MNDRKKREARQARMAALEASKPLPTARPAQRGTIRVAQAQRQLAADLPGVVRVRQAAPVRTAPRGVSLQSAQPIAQGDRKRPLAQVAQSVQSAQPKLDKGDLNLKCRPKSTKPASGGGSGRNFIPWGNC